MSDNLHDIHTPCILDVCVNVFYRDGSIHLHGLSPALCLTQNRVSVYLGLNYTPHCCRQDSGRLTQYIKDNRINETSKIRVGNTKEAKCRIALRVRAVKSGLSLEVDYKLTSDVFHSTESLLERTVGSTVRYSQLLDSS